MGESGGKVMKPVRELFKRFQKSDGRIKALTATGVLALAAVVALAIGVLPAMAAHVDPVQVDWGGGSGACADDAVLLEDGVTTYGPSAARYELHIQNPMTDDYFGPDGTKFHIEVNEDDTAFDFQVLTANMVVYDAFANGGKKTNLTDYDGNDAATDNDQDVVAPEKENKPGEHHKLSHVNICYDLTPTSFECPPLDPETIDGDGLFDFVTVTIFENSLWDCSDKTGFLIVNNEEDPPNLLLAFNGDGTDTVAGRADITKMFDDPDDFGPLLYSEIGDFATATEVPWCNTRAFDTDDSDGLVDGDQFEDWLPTGVGGLYPELPAGDSACKVAEDEDLTGKQVTYVYFEFLDPVFY
jgi:hypothetical protein